MPKSNASKIQFSKQKLFVLENLLPRFDKYIGQPSEVNLLDNPLKQFMGPSDVNCLTTSQHNSPENLPSKFLSQNFYFLLFSCHALTHNILGCPRAYGMHYANSKIFMLIYIFHGYINIIKFTQFMLFKLQQ